MLFCQHRHLWSAILYTIVANSSALLSPCHPLFCYFACIVISYDSKSRVSAIWGALNPEVCCPAAPFSALTIILFISSMPSPPLTDLHLDVVVGLATKQDPTEMPSTLDSTIHLYVANYHYLDGRTTRRVGRVFPGIFRLLKAVKPCN